MVSGLVEEQGQPGVEFDRIDIKKLISNWDAMAGDGFSEQPGLGGGWGGGSGRWRRSSAEFIQKTQMFEEQKLDGCVGEKEELLVVKYPKKPRCAYINYTEISSKFPSTSPGPSSWGYRFK